MTDLLLNAREVAQILHIAPSTVYARADEFGAVRLGGSIRFKESTITRLVSGDDVE